MKDDVCVAAIVGAHGIQGTVKLKSFTENPTDFAAYGPVHDAQAHCYDVKIHRLCPKGIILVRIKGVQDRTQAEALKGTQLYVSRAQLPSPEEGSFYVSDLVGFQISDEEGGFLGVVQMIQNYGAGDFIEVASIGPEGQLSPTTITIPFNKDAVISVDKERRLLVVKAEFVLRTGKDG